MIAFDCLRCGDEYEVGDDQAGRVAPCLRCGTRLAVPAAGEDLGSVGGFPLAPPPPPPVIEVSVIVPPPAPSARRVPRPEPEDNDADTYGFGDKDDRRAPKNYPRDRDDDEPRRRPAPRSRYDDDDDNNEPRQRPSGAPPAEPLLGVASLVLAGVSLLLALFAPYLGVVAAILAAGVGFLALKTPGKTLGLIGLCCAIVLLLVNSVLTVLWLAGGVPTKSSAPTVRPTNSRFPRR